MLRRKNICFGQHGILRDDKELARDSLKIVTQGQRQYSILFKAQKGEANILINENPNPDFTPSDATTGFSA